MAESLHIKPEPQQVIKKKSPSVVFSRLSQWQNKSKTIQWKKLRNCDVIEDN